MIGLIGGETNSLYFVLALVIHQQNILLEVERVVGLGESVYTTIGFILSGLVVEGLAEIYG